MNVTPVLFSTNKLQKVIKDLKSSFILNFEFEFSINQNVSCLVNRNDQTTNLSEQVHQEYIVISYTDAIIDPGTVMIVPVNTPVANDAVTRALGSDGLAFGTQA